MKKIWVIVAVFALLVLADVLWLTYKEQKETNESNKELQKTAQKALEDIQIAKGGQGKKNISGIEADLKSKKAKEQFCYKSLKRLFEKGRNINELEFAKLQKLFNRNMLKNYYTCKAIENLDSDWCTPLKFQKQEDIKGLSFRDCNNSFTIYVIVKLGFANKTPMSADEIDKALMQSGEESRKKIVENARLIVDSKSLEDCEKLTIDFGTYPCQILKTEKFPDIPPESEWESDPIIHDNMEETTVRDKYLALKAVHDKDPSLLDGTTHEDLFVLRGLFFEEPNYCDQAFEEIAKLKCQSY